MLYLLFEGLEMLDWVPFVDEAIAITTAALSTPSLTSINAQVLVGILIPLGAYLPLGTYVFTMVLIGS